MDYNYHEHFDDNPKLHFEACLGALLLQRARFGETYPVEQMRFITTDIERNGYTRALMKDLPLLLA